MNENYLKRVCIILRTINRYLTKLFGSVRKKYNEKGARELPLRPVYYL
nr:MAG TPA: hypothetical protein [Microviridae sp.]